jgi:erythromycin esterase-like protein
VTAIRRGSYLRLLPLALILIVIGPGAWAQPREDSCTDAGTKWERVVKDLNDKLGEYNALRDRPVERIVERPLVNGQSGKSMAKQISEAVQAKEKLLAEKRQECSDLLGQEADAFEAFQRCMETMDNSQKRSAKRMIEKREKLLRNVQVTIAEVREVEGKNHYSNYADPWRDQWNYYNRGGGWQDYQRMYRGYYGR